MGGRGLYRAAGGPLPGVDGDAHLQEGPQVDAWKDREQREDPLTSPPSHIGRGRGGVCGGFGGAQCLPPPFWGTPYL